MMKIKQLAVFSILGFMILAAQAAHAAGPSLDSSGRKKILDKKEARIEEVYKGLNLTADQRKQLGENKAKNREQMKSLFRNMKEKKGALSEELQKDTLDMAKITQINNELKALQAQMLDQRLEGILEVRKILTPEQFKRFTAGMGEKGNRGRRWDARQGGSRP